MTDFELEHRIKCGPVSRWWDLPDHVRAEIISHPDIGHSTILAWLHTPPDEGGPDDGPFEWVSYTLIRDWRQRRVWLRPRN